MREMRLFYPRLRSAPKRAVVLQFPAPAVAVPVAMVVPVATIVAAAPVAPVAPAQPAVPVPPTQVQPPEPPAAPTTIVLEPPSHPENRAFCVTVAGMQTYWCARTRDRARYLALRAAWEAGWADQCGRRALMYRSRCVRCPEMDAVAQRQEEGYVP